MLCSFNECLTCELQLVRVITEPLLDSVVDAVVVIITAEIKVSPQMKLE